MADTSVTAPATARARRATRRDFVDCAFEILAESGHKGLTIHELCRKVGVSTGSFYHHFANWDEFVAALLTQWEGDQAQQMVEAATATSNLRRIEIARDLASMYQHGAEAAIRAWSLSNAQVRIAQEHVDDERRRHLVSLLRRSGSPMTGRTCWPASAWRSLSAYNNSRAAPTRSPTPCTCISRWSSRRSTHTTASASPTACRTDGACRSGNRARRLTERRSRALHPSLNTAPGQPSRSRSPRHHHRSRGRPRCSW